MPIKLLDFQHIEINLMIDSITLVDGVTPDESVQYKVGRDVSYVNWDGEGQVALVAYNEKLGWKTYPLSHITNTEDALILTDSESIYTFKKKK